MGNSDELVQKIMEHYPLEIHSSALISDKGKKAAWQLQTTDGPRVLKKVPGEEDRVRFVAEATVHLRNAGAGVPTLEQTRTGDIVVICDGIGYIVMNWVRGSKPDLTAPGDVCALLQALGKFHRASRDFIPSTATGTRSHIGVWPKTMQRHTDQLQAFLARARASDDRFSRVFCQDAKDFISRGKDCLQRLEVSGYSDWVSRVEREKNLCHQDFAPRNLRMHPDGSITVFDMDSVTFDLPARDLRKVFNKLGKKGKSWEAENLRQLAACYQKTNPLTRAEWEVVLLDLWYPHLVYGLVSKYYESRAPDWSEEKFVKKLHEVVKVEKGKQAVLSELLTRGVVS